MTNLTIERLEELKTKTNLFAHNLADYIHDFDVIEIVDWHADVQRLITAEIERQQTKASVTDEDVGKAIEKIELVASAALNTLDEDLHPEGDYNLYVRLSDYIYEIEYEAIQALKDWRPVGNDDEFDEPCECCQNPVTEVVYTNQHGLEFNLPLDYMNYCPNCGKELNK